MGRGGRMPLSVSFGPPGQIRAKQRARQNRCSFPTSGQLRRTAESSRPGTTSSVQSDEGKALLARMTVSYTHLTLPTICSV
eukprot:2694115-Rhodomonas_salina.1